MRLSNHCICVRRTTNHYRSTVSLGFVIQCFSNININLGIQTEDILSAKFRLGSLILKQKVELSIFKNCIKVTSCNNRI